MYLQVFPHVATRFSDTSSFLCKLTLKSMLVLAPKVSCTNFQCWSRAKSEKVMMCMATIILG